MRRPMMMVLVVLAAAIAGGGALQQALAAGSGGGLSLSPSILEHAAQPGSVGSLTLSNTTANPLQVTVTPRPWLQSSAGRVSPDRRHKLADVGVSAASFVLAAGAQRSVALSLLRAPRGGSLYGNVDVVGTPVDAKKRTGIVVAFRLVSSLRLNPTAARRKLSLTVGDVRAAKRALAVAVRNAGNTIDPVSGTLRLSGALGGRSTTIAATRILPGAIVRLGAGSTAGLPKGSYTATVTLSQGGRKVVSAKRKLRIG